MERSAEVRTDFRRISAADFAVGVLHQLAKQSPQQKFRFDTRDRKLHAAFAASFNQLEEHADSHNEYLDFRILPDEFHGISQTLSDQLLGLVYIDPVEGHHGSYVDLIYDATHPIAEWLEERIPGSPELYRELADVFREAYYAPAQRS